MKKIWLPLVFAFLTTAASAQSQYDEETRSNKDNESFILVAKKALLHPLYGQSMILAKAVSGGFHMGFLLNKPTRVRMGEAFPDHKLSQEIKEPLFFGGPVDVNMIFALVHTNASPGKGSFQFSEELFVAVAGDTVESIIAKNPDKARYLFGSVIWRAGELADEISRGMWHTLDVDIDLVFSKVSGAKIWEKALIRAEKMRNAL